MNKTKRKIFVIAVILIICTILGIVIFKFLSSKKENDNYNIEQKENSNNDYQIVSKYNPETKTCEDVKVKINSIVKGEEAKNILDNYNKSAEFPVEIKLEDNEEFIIVNYKIDFDKFNMGENGVSKDLEVRICQSEEKSYIEYNDKVYAPMGYCINNLEYTKENTTNGKCVMIIPKDLQDYKIRIGVNDQKVFYFNGI